VEKTPGREKNSCARNKQAGKPGKGTIVQGTVVHGTNETVHMATDNYEENTSYKSSIF
jgi:hypothetical protein